MNKAVVRSADPMLAVPDLSAAVSFYVERLGFTHHTTYGDPPFYAIVTRDAVWINMIASETASGDAGDRGGFYIRVDDVNALHEEWSAHDVEIWGPPTDRDYGMRDFIAVDLYGYRICAGQRID